MAIDTALGLLAVLLLILATGLFVAAEFAFVAVDRGRVERLAAEGVRPARTVERLLQRLSFHLSGAQLGITVTSLVLGFIAQPTVAEAIEPAVGSRGVSIAIALLLVTVGSMVVSELIPKSLAISKPERTAFALGRVMAIYGVLFGPLIRMLNSAANATVRRLGIEPVEELTAVRSLEELELLIRSSGEEGTLDPEAFTLLTRTLRFGTKTAADALVPRLSVVWVAPDTTLPALIDMSVSTGSSRFPVCGSDLDDVVGVVHVKDVYRIPAKERPAATVAAIMAEPFVVPESRDLASLLIDLRQIGSHMAIVIDEYGGTAGIITLEDVLEEIVGEIDDEYDFVTPALTGGLPEGTFLVPGSLHEDEVLELCGFEMPEGEFETLAGFVLAQLGHIPEPHERFQYEGWRFEVVELDRLRVKSVVLDGAPVECRPLTALLLVLAVFLLLANGYFVAVEFALIASRRTKLEQLAETGNARARMAVAATKQVSLQLAGAQLGITMASLGLGAVAEPAIAHLLEDALEAIVELPAGLLHTISFVLALTIVVFLHMVIGEMVPKNVAIADPERTLMALALPNRLYVVVFGPAIRVLNAIANAGTRLMGVEPRDELATAATADELAHMLAASREEGLVDEVAHDLLTGVLDFGERPVRAVMVSMPEVVRVTANATVGEAEEVIVASGHSRLVVVDERTGAVLGFVHAKDLLTIPVDARGDRPIPVSRIRRMLVVSVQRPLDEVLVAMRRSRTHMATVVEEGQPIGIATLENVLEDLVGEIFDESDPEARPRITPRRRGRPVTKLQRSSPDR